MTTTTIAVPPFNTTLMGVIRGVADAFGLPHSDAWLYGGTSHAFLINIHKELCPSGPYCWNPQRMRSLSGGLGLVMHDHGFFHAGSTEQERHAVEALLEERLDGGYPCSLLNMENQLITGFDDTGFDLTQPWAPHADLPPGRLTYGSWAELGEEIHLNFFSYEQTEPADARPATIAALQCAVDMVDDPGAFTDSPYAVGLAAYDSWLAAIEAGLGGSHGNWWNGTVWAECRGRAGEYLREVAARFPEVESSSVAAASKYEKLHGLLEKVSDKELEAAQKAEALQAARTLEAQAVDGLRDVLTQFVAAR